MAVILTSIVLMVVGIPGFVHTYVYTLLYSNRHLCNPNLPFTVERKGDRDTSTVP